MSRRDEVEAIVKKHGNWEDEARALRKFSCTLADEVDARDKVIAELLALMEPGPKPKYCSFDIHRQYRELYREWETKTDLHTKALAIAGRDRG